MIKSNGGCPSTVLWHTYHYVVLCLLSRIAKFEALDLEARDTRAVQKVCGQHL